MLKICWKDEIFCSPANWKAWWLSTKDMRWERRWENIENAFTRWFWGDNLDNSPLSRSLAATDVCKNKYHCTNVFCLIKFFILVGRKFRKWILYQGNIYGARPPVISLLSCWANIGIWLERWLLGENKQLSWSFISVQSIWSLLEEFPKRRVLPNNRTTITNN